MSPKIVIGNGLIARAFNRAGVDNTCYFASGISNSLVADKAQFDREEQLLRSSIAICEDRSFVYFSTCDVHYAKDKPYAIHKLRMENIIEELCKKYFIFRLSQVVGVSNNTTIVPFFTKKIILGESLQLCCTAQRNIIAIDDVVRVVNKVILNSNLLTNNYNLISLKNVFVIDIANKISKILGRSLVYSEYDSNTTYAPVYNGVEPFLDTNDPLFDHLYWINVLEHYVPKIANSIVANEQKANLNKLF